MMLTAAFSIEALLPANDAHVWLVGPILGLLCFGGAALTLLGAIFTSLALLERRHRHPLAIVGLLLNVATLCLGVLLLAWALGDD